MNVSERAPTAGRVSRSPGTPPWPVVAARRAGRGRHGSAWVALAALAWVAGAEAQSAFETDALAPTAYGGAVTGATAGVAAAASDIPFGLAAVWRHDEYRLGRDLPSRTTGGFALAGDFYAIRSDAGLRLLTTADGSVLGRWPAPSPQDAYALAVSSAGLVAVGRVGRVEVSGPGRERRLFNCADACGPVLDVAFSPDGRLLAYQGARGRRDRERGLGYAVVLDTETGRAVARLEAIAARALVAFSADGETLVASNVTSFDDSETFGVRTWRTSDWQLTGNLPGTTERWRSIGRLGDSALAAAYETEGRLEIRDLVTNRSLWSAPLIGAALAGDGLEAAAPADTRLAHVALAPSGAFVLSYETSRLAELRGAGTLVIRDGRNGDVIALYDVTDVTDVAIAPDSRTFVYSARGNDSYTVLARVPM